MTGRIGDSGEETVVVEVSGVDKLVAFEDVARALVQIEFNRKSVGPAHDEPEDADAAGDEFVDGDTDDEETEHG